MGEHGQLVTTALTLAGFILSLVAFSLRMNQSVNDKIEKAKEEGDAKRARIYERLDAVKTMHTQELDDVRKEVADRFVDVKICKILHDNTDRIFTEIKAELTSIKESLCILADKISAK